MSARRCRCRRGGGSLSAEESNAFVVDVHV